MHRHGSYHRVTSAARSCPQYRHDVHPREQRIRRWAAAGRPEYHPGSPESEVQLVVLLSEARVGPLEGGPIGEARAYLLVGLVELRDPLKREDRLDARGQALLRKTAGVPPRGFEPLISTLKGWRPRPLDDGGTMPRRWPSLAEDPRATGRRRTAERAYGPLDTWNRMIAAAALPAAAIAAPPPTSDNSSARRPLPTSPARQVARRL